LCGFNTGNRNNVPQPKRRQVRKVESSHGARDVAERVASFVAIPRGIGKFAATHTVEDYKDYLLRG
jgi:hypothetical protein